MYNKVCSLKLKQLEAAFKTFIAAPTLLVGEEFEMKTIEIMKESSVQQQQ